MKVDLNQLIPAFLAASDEQRCRAMAVLRAPELEQANDPNWTGHNQLFNQTEIAKTLRVHPTTIRRWRLPCYRLGRVPRYRLDEVMEYVGSQAFRHRLQELKKQK